ncbi:MAG: AAA family ATPase, partial [Dehalococcoidales bacterium]|nr:AAA family ATPase [Dehalococcoidales bacterium]
MLDELTVKGFGIIETITWRPGGGLNVITGETGAGKSLVVDAVDALLSGQVKEEDIRHGEDAAQVEGLFSMPAGAGAVTGDLVKILADKGLATGDDTLLLSCDFRRQGRTVPRVNRQAVSRALLKDIGAALVDIHGQSEHLSLLRKDHHIDFLDAHAHTLELRQEFGAGAAELNQMERELESLSRNDRDNSRQMELLNFQIDEIYRAELRDGEEEELRNELTLLTSAEKLKATAYEVYRALYGEDGASESSSSIDMINQ